MVPVWWFSVAGESPVICHWHITQEWNRLTIHPSDFTGISEQLAKYTEILNGPNGIDSSLRRVRRKITKPQFSQAGTGGAADRQKPQVAQVPERDRRAKPVTGSGERPEHAGVFGARGPKKSEVGARPDHDRAARAIVISIADRFTVTCNRAEGRLRRVYARSLASTIESRRHGDLRTSQRLSARGCVFASLSALTWAVSRTTRVTSMRPTSSRRCRTASRRRPQTPALDRIRILRCT